MSADSGSQVDPTPSGGLTRSGRSGGTLESTQGRSQVDSTASAGLTRSGRSGGTSTAASTKTPAPADSPGVAHPKPWRWREREWVWLAATVSMVCLLFAAWPSVDLLVSGWFYRDGSGFVGNRWLAVRLSYEGVPWLGRGAALAALMLALSRWRPAGRFGLRWRRRTLVLGLALLIGTGVVVNGAFKENWGRARPRSIEAFGGGAVFAPALRPSNQCARNCAFVSGHAATGFAVMAVGLLGGPATRRRWLLIGMACGLGVGAVRIMQGGHFLSDVLFSGLIVWTCNAALREAWLAARARRLRQASTARGKPSRCGVISSDSSGPDG